MPPKRKSKKPTKPRKTAAPIEPEAPPVDMFALAGVTDLLDEPVPQRDVGEKRAHVESNVPEKRARTVITTHASARQPGDAELDALLGAPTPATTTSIPPAPATKPRTVRVQETDIRARVAAATMRARDKFYNATHVAARYASSNAVKDFITQRDDDSGGGGGSTLHSAAGAERSNIDIMLAASNNAAEMARRTTQARARVNGIPAVLADRNKPLTIDEFANRVLGMNTLDSINNEFFDEPYQVDGLSQRVPNPDWEQLERERCALEARRAALVLEGAQFGANRQFVNDDSLIYKQRTQDELREMLIEFAPLESVELLKPASEVRAINERWRALLGEALVTVYREYELATTSSLAEQLGDAVDARDASNIASLYMQRVVGPTFSQYLEQLRAATYEDMPLSREIVQDYFYTFMGISLDAMLREKASHGEEALRRLQALTIKDSARNVAEALEQQADRWRRVVATADDDDVGSHSLFDGAGPDLNAQDSLGPGERERRVVIAYMRQALFIYASPVYNQWFERWLLRVRSEEPTITLPEDVVNTLRMSVHAMVNGRERVHRERDARSGRSMPRYELMSEQQIVTGYARLLNNDVALQRAHALKSEEAERALATAFDIALQGATPEVRDAESASVPIELLLHPRADRFELLAAVAVRQRLHIEETFRMSQRDNEEEDERFDDALTGARDDALADLDLREATLREQILLYSPMEDVKAHGPRDEPIAGTDDTYTPFDLSYPLDITLTIRQEPELVGIVERLGETYDAATIHEHADKLRASLSYGYAQQLIEREVMRIDYALRYLAQPERDAPLCQTRVLNSTRPLELRAEVKLRDELALMAAAPNNTLVDERIGLAQRALQRSRWRVQWYFKARYGPESDRDHVIETQLLPRGTRIAVLTRPSMPATPETLGGLYWAVFELLDDTDAVVVTARSRFTALVRIIATCRRTGKEFEVGDTQYGDATWREAPRSATMRDIAEEWLVIVTRGEGALNELLVQRADNARVRATMPEPSLFLPPWGADDEASLYKTYGAITNEDFSIKAVFGALIRRIGGQLKAELAGVSRNTATPAQLRFRLAPYAQRSPMQLFALLVDASVLAPDSIDYDEMARVIQMHAAQTTAAGCWSDRTLGNGSMFLQGIDTNTLGEPLLLTASDHVVARINADVNNVTLLTLVQQRMLHGGVDPELFDPDALPYTGVRTLTRDFSRPVEEMPLATLLAALYTPIVWLNMTWRERRFANEIHRRFEEFARDYRITTRRQLYYSQLFQDQTWSRHAPRPIVYANSDTRLRDPAVPPEPTPVVERLEREIDRRLSMMTANSVKNQLGKRAYAIGDSTTDAGQRISTSVLGAALESWSSADELRDSACFEYDVALMREYAELIQQRLVRTGLLVVEPRVSESSLLPISPCRHPALAARMVEDPRTFTRFSIMQRTPQTDDDTRPPTPGVYRGGRQMWTGTFSYTTDQPDIYSLIIDDQRGAVIEQRGSTPLGKGYDFDGIHNVIVSTVQLYTATVRGTGVDGMTQEARTRARDTLAQRLRDLELAYNFFAFVAHPLGSGRFLSVEALMLLLEDRQEFFTRIGMAAMRTGAATLL